MRILLRWTLLAALDETRCRSIFAIAFDFKVIWIEQNWCFIFPELNKLGKIANNFFFQLETSFQKATWSLTRIRRAFPDIYKLKNWTFYYWKKLLHVEKSGNLLFMFSLQHGWHQYLILFETKWQKFFVN